MVILFFALGAIVASFVGVVVARLNTWSSFVTGRSRCDACNAALSDSALVPIVAYVVSRGRARCCGAKISVAAPLTELLLAVLFAASYLKLGLTTSLPLLLVELSLLLALVLYDLSHQILPPVMLYPFVAVAVTFRSVVAESATEVTNALIAAGVVGLVFLAMHLFSRGRAMGFADTPLAFGLSLLVGPALSFAGVCFSFWIGAAIGITILLRRPRGSRMGIEVPFAPFLAAGFLLAYYVIPWNPLYLLITS
ncbi:hypothetical protein COU19_03180 [Candidatus Kaiserbacteria bacterium CG10_big_fil_rev_8_21_14_0_10_56_12]|uniref:Prepilin peptidase n=1 Tax=Candidatus Kaiserbacteria bacterium CG10_big_fil_rev_8_21_14_0_10_56_12 TaxID=1974611 RepID=A0A2H0U945_9BACT|nr:MAG: hypothetical protein COU19_03180 [Candidatus Kaiserbacteria bacterium CG10_big_fil_rev_8_21_14_0_10_56_12]